MRRGYQAVRLFWLLLSPLLVYLLIMDLAFLAWEIGECEKGERPDLLLTAIGAAVASLPLGVWYRRGREERNRKYSEKRGRGPLMACSVIAGVGACLFFNGMLDLLPLSSEGYGRVRSVLFQPSLTVQLICMGLVIPLGEELVFRGLGYGRLRRELSTRTAVTVSAVWFGLYHGNLLQGLYAGLLGTIAALFYESSGCLWSCWLFHGTANVTAIAGTLLSEGEDFFLLRKWELPAMVLGGGLLLFCNKIRRD